jgi:thiol-disulfide isomerase/thioredoxin
MPDTSGSSVGRRDRRRYWRWLRDALVLVLIVAGVQWWQARDLVQGTAPPLVGLMLDGQPFQLDYAEGPYLVHFWATWCPVCRLEHGNIASLAEDLPVVTVATSSGTADEIRDFLLQEDTTALPVLLDERGAIARQWGVFGVPASFIVDTEGGIVYAGKGYSTGWGLRLRLWFAD